MFRFSWFSCVPLDPSWIILGFGDSFTFKDFGFTHVTYFLKNQRFFMETIIKILTTWYLYKYFASICDNKGLFWRFIVAFTMSNEVLHLKSDYQAGVFSSWCSHVQLSLMCGSSRTIAVLPKSISIQVQGLSNRQFLWQWEWLFIWWGIILFGDWKMERINFLIFKDIGSQM